MSKYIKLIRLHHWVKNILISIVFLFNPGIWTIANISQLLLLILFWGLIASSGYIINDILDVENDRLHPTKRFRPIASGDVSIKSALTIAVMFIVVSFVCTYLLSVTSFIVLICYFVLNTCYSLYLKTIRYLDIIILTAFYMLRIIIGATLFDLEITNWFFATSFFGFLAISIKKREMETYKVKDGQKTRRKYSKADSITLNTLSYIAAFASLIFLNLHTILYLHLKNIYLLLFINASALYVVFSFLDKESITDDPVKTFLKNPIFYIIAVALTAIYIYIISQSAG